MKTFGGDFDKFLNKIKSGEHFSLSRWGDGELMILEGNAIDIRSKGNGEFRYDPNLPQYKRIRDILIESFEYKDDNYYIGIACPCCVGQEKYQYMKDKSKQDEEHLTWANIFVNGNYRRTINELIPELSNHSVTILVNKNADVSGLPFKPNQVLRIGTDAWCDDFDIGRDILENILMRGIKNEIFLFAAGPLANMLTYGLWRHGSKKNTYIDIGSILDPYLGLKITRGYQLGAPTLNKICIW